MPPKKAKQLNDSNEMINFYELKKVQKFMTKSINPNFKYHNIKVPFRSINIGSSGSGKSNMILNLISQMGDTFNHIYIVTQAVEPLYEYLQSQISDEMLTIFYGLDSFRKFKEADYYGQSLIIFDDMVNEKDQKIICEMYIRGRKMGVSMMYLSQSYFKIPKIIRLQCQYIFIVKISGARDLNMILSEYSLGETKEQLNNIYNYCCNRGIFGSFLLIDLEADQKKTYRRNLKEYLTPQNF